MSSGARVAWCAAAATALAACALLPLVDTATWIFEALLLLAIQCGVGALARRVPLARPVTVALQALVTLLLLTLTFAGDQALAGIVPGPAAIDRLGALLHQGGVDVGQYATPAPLTDGIRLMLVGGVLVVGLVVDAVAVTFRSAAPAGLALLALYSVAAGLSNSAADWLWFALAAGGYLLLLLAEGRDRVLQWGRVFGSAGRPGRTAGGLESGSGGAVAPVRSGRRIGALALGIALVVPLALPTLDGGLLGDAGGGRGRGPGGGTISAVNPLVSLQDSLNQDQDRQVMSYRTNTRDTQDMYLRIVALDEFDGTAWKPAVRHIESVPAAFPDPPGLGPEVDRSEIRTNIQAAEWYAQDWLPMPYPVTSVEIDGRWRYEPVGRTLVGDHGQTTRGRRWSVASLEVRPTADQLATAGEAPQELREEFTAVPKSLPPVVARTAREVTANASNAYEQAVRLQDWFAQDGGFTYNTQVQAGSGPAAIARFLRQKEGFCVHFAFSMAAMARTLGIPARVAVGFTPGTPQPDGSMSVGLKDAHAWPELYFEGAGWTRFEPTPTRGSVPDYTRAQNPSGDVPAPRTPEESASAQPSAQPSRSESCPAQERRLGGCASAPPAAASGSGHGGPDAGLVAGVVVAALLVIVLPLLPLLWRRRVRARRLGAHGRSEGDAAAHTLALWQEVVDLAWDHGIAPDDSLTPRGTAERVVRGSGIDPVAAEAVHRVASAVERVLYAPRPLPPRGSRRTCGGSRPPSRPPPHGGHGCARCCCRGPRYGSCGRRRRAGSG